MSDASLHCILYLLTCRYKITSVLYAARKSDQDSMLCFVIPAIPGNTEHAIQVRMPSLFPVAIKTWLSSMNDHYGSDTFF